MTTDRTTEARPGRALNIVLWVLQVFLGLFFIAASGAPKILGQADAVEGFELIGGGDWFRIFIGVVEIAGGIGLLIPRLAGLAAIGLGIVMIGAAYTNAFIIDGFYPVATPLILLVFFVFIAWGRRDRTRALFTRST